jgi:Ca2+-binding EF-hand superfamily protein
VIDATELRMLFNDLNENLSDVEFKELMSTMDKDRSGFIGHSKAE